MHRLTSLTAAALLFGLSAGTGCGTDTATTGDEPAADASKGEGKAAGKANDKSSKGGGALKIDKAEKGADDKESALNAHFQERIFRAQISDVLYFKNTLNITKNVEKLLNSPANIRSMEKLAKEKAK